MQKIKDSLEKNKELRKAKRKYYAVEYMYSDLRRIIKFSKFEPLCLKIVSRMMYNRGRHIGRALEHVENLLISLLEVRGEKDFSNYFSCEIGHNSHIIEFGRAFSEFYAQEAFPFTKMFVLEYKRFYWAYNILMSVNRYNQAEEIESLDRNAYRFKKLEFNSIYNKIVNFEIGVPKIEKLEQDFKKIEESCEPFFQLYQEENNMHKIKKMIINWKKMNSKAPTCVHTIVSNWYISWAILFCQLGVDYYIADMLLSQFGVFYDCIDQTKALKVYQNLQLIFGKKLLAASQPCSQMKKINC